MRRQRKALPLRVWRESAVGALLPETALELLAWKASKLDVVAHLKPALEPQTYFKCRSWPR